MDYRREIDGLRALAVVPVILFHAGFESFKGGSVGVDVFFVISGYLITTIILSELEQGKFSIVNFYERRARRILPVLFLVMLVCIPFAWFRLFPGDMKEFSRSLVAVPLFVSNILFLSETGYFETAAELKPLLHTWSLAVEEQYYVFFPLLLMLLWRSGRRWMLAGMTLVFVVSLAAAQWGVHAMPDAAFFLLPTRGWELLVGAFAAFYLSRADRAVFGRGLSETGGWLGLVLILYAVFSFSKDTPVPGIHALIPTLGAVLIILFATQQTAAGRFVGNRVFVGIGLVSYSAYLWHQPLFAFARHGSLTEPSRLAFSLLSVLSLALAYLSWRHVETPFRSKAVFGRRAIFSMALAFSLFFIAFGYVGNKLDGFMSRLPETTRFPGDELPKIDNGWCFYHIDRIASLNAGADGLRCVLGDAGANAKGILFGDSFAGQYEPLWDRAARDARLKIVAVTTNWCHPSLKDGFVGPADSRAFGQCLFNREYLKNNAADYDFVVLGGSWGSVFSKGKLDDVLETIAFLSGRVKAVVVMAAPRKFDTNPVNEYKRSLWYGYKFDIGRVGSSKDDVTKNANDVLRRHAEGFANVVFVDRDSLFLRDGRPSDVTEEGIPYSLDGGHISIYGSKSAAVNFIKSSDYARFKSLLE